MKPQKGSFIGQIVYFIILVDAVSSSRLNLLCSQPTYIGRNNDKSNNPMPAISKTRLAINVLADAHFDCREMLCMPLQSRSPANVCSDIQKQPKAISAIAKESTNT